MGHLAYRESRAKSKRRTRVSDPHGHRDLCNLTAHANEPMVGKSRRFLPMDGLRLEVFPQRTYTTRTIRECSGDGSGSGGADFFYGGAAYGDVEEFVEDQRFVFLAGEAADDRSQQAAGGARAGGPDPGGPRHIASELIGGNQTAL